MKYEIHGLAKLIPEMSEDEFKELVKDIEANGLLEPITLYEGMILDGRHRYRACMEIGLVPEFEEYTGNDAFLFVISKNLHRRHLNSSQKADIARGLMPHLEERAKERRISTLKQNSSVSQEIDSRTDNGRAAEQAAKIAGTNRQYVYDAIKIEQEAPELLDKIRLGEMSIPEAKKEIRKQEIQTARTEIAKKGAQVELSSRWNVWQANIETWKAPRQYDFIITDPPYPKEFLHLYEVLAERATEWLKPGGLLIAMCGQSYLNQIYEMMSKHMTYYWTACYLTLHQPTPLRHVNVNTTWKPLLMYRNDKYTGKIFGDVFRSDQNIKDNHKWEQSVEGMNSIISMICLPGQYILDPFCGAGTTGIAALKNNCLFDGIDLEIENVNISKARLHDS